MWVAALEQQAGESVQQHMLTPTSGDLDVVPNLWGEGLLVTVPDHPSNLELPVWLYLGDGDHTYALDSESARLTPGLRKFDSAPPDEQRRARLDRTSVEEIRRYIKSGR